MYTVYIYLCIYSWVDVIYLLPWVFSEAQGKESWQNRECFSFLILAGFSTASALYIFRSTVLSRHDMCSFFYITKKATVLCIELEGRNFKILRFCNKLDRLFFVFQSEGNMFYVKFWSVILFFQRRKYLCLEFYNVLLAILPLTKLSSKLS